MVKWRGHHRSKRLVWWPWKYLLFGRNAKIVEIKNLFAEKKLYSSKSHQLIKPPSYVVNIYIYNLHTHEVALTINAISTTKI